MRTGAVPRIWPLVTLTAMIVLLSAPNLSSGQRAAEWVIGRWEGTIHNFAGPTRGRRVMRIWSAAEDGTGLGTWSIPERELYRARITLEDQGVRVITAADSVVELRRSGDDWLVGTFKLKDGRSFPVSLAKAAPSAKFDEERIVAAKLVGMYDGTKQGFGVRTLDDDFARVLSVEGIERGDTEWKATARVGRDRDRLSLWATTLTVTGTETAIALAPRWGGEMVLHLRSPGHLVGSIRQPAGEHFAISFKRVDPR